MSQSPMHTTESEKSEAEKKKEEDEYSDDDNGFWSDDDDEQVYVNDKRIENYEEYQYSV